MTVQKMRFFSNATLELQKIHLNRPGTRILNSSLDEGETSRPLGYREGSTGDRYKVLWLAAPISRANVESIVLALTAVADRPNFSTIVKPKRDPAAPRQHHGGFPPHSSMRTRRSNPASAGAIL